MNVLFIHGLASSGAFKTAGALRNLLRPCTVISPDLPIEPYEALSLLKSICEEYHPDLLVGHSLGGFFAQQLRGFRKVLINPSFYTGEFMRQTMLGEVKYLNVRENGDTTFTITEDICDSYVKMEAGQFEGIDEAEIALTHGMFAIEDEVVNCKADFEKYYPGRSVSYHGTHLPVFKEIKEILIPIVKL